MMSDNVLKSCPFCGGHAIYSYKTLFTPFACDPFYGYVRSNIRYASREGHIECEKCGARSKDYKKIITAEKNWNRRVV